ncbi:type IV pilus modification PilV family protein [Demequina aurantiaca]|uniref:type IV pilus modification PilV family protein n=1 Tax=Demequina aurantiaca TaxID=676200 RepID=UPI003D33EF73
MHVQQLDDEGFGLTEALVAILLFGILSLALVPPIILALQTSAKSTVIATASAVASERVDLARQNSGTCAEYVAFLSTAVPTTYEDARGSAFTVTQSPTPAYAAGQKVSPVGGAGDGNADGVADSFCDDGDSHQNAMDFSVDVVSSSLDNPDAASAQTLVAVPGFGG